MNPRILLSASGAALGIAGLAGLFAPATLVRHAAGPGVLIPSVLVQLGAAACLGLACANWLGRGLVLGGIYGRALVVGNQVQWTVGLLVSVRAALDRPLTPGAVGIVVAYGIFACGFTWLLYHHPGPPEAPAS